MSDQRARTARTTTALSGRTFEYTYSSGIRASLEFGDDTVHWKILAGRTAGEEGTNEYLAREIAAGVHLVQWFEPEIDATITLAINEIAGTVSSSEAYPGERVFDTAVIHDS